jgi:hypothetical protein
MRLPYLRLRHHRRELQAKVHGKTAWDDARAVASEWEKCGSWDGEVLLPEPLAEPTQPSRVTIERGVKAFLDEF